LRQNKCNGAPYIGRAYKKIEPHPPSRRCGSIFSTLILLFPLLSPLSSPHTQQGEKLIILSPSPCLLCILP
jgi:hypothetical protein